MSVFASSPRSPSPLTTSKSSSPPPTPRLVAPTPSPKILMSPPSSPTSSSTAPPRARQARRSWTWSVLVRDILHSIRDSTASGYESEPEPEHLLLFDPIHSQRGSEEDANSPKCRIPKSTSNSNGLEILVKKEGIRRVTDTDFSALLLDDTAEKNANANVNVDEKVYVDALCSAGRASGYVECVALSSSRSTPGKIRTQTQTPTQTLSMIRLGSQTQALRVLIIRDLSELTLACRWWSSSSSSHDDVDDDDGGRKKHQLRILIEVRVGQKSIGSCEVVRRVVEFVRVAQRTWDVPIVIAGVVVKMRRRRRTGSLVALRRTLRRVCVFLQVLRYMRVDKGFEYVVLEGSEDSGEDGSLASASRMGEIVKWVHQTMLFKVPVRLLAVKSLEHFSSCFCFATRIRNDIEIESDRTTGRRRRVYRTSDPGMSIVRKSAPSSVRARVELLFRSEEKNREGNRYVVGPKFLVPVQSRIVGETKDSNDVIADTTIFGLGNRGDWILLPGYVETFRECGRRNKKRIYEIVNDDRILVHVISSSGTLT